ncbi:hypothetical protein HYFRA_00013062 [Hymenoscyphus fraxineus]|uniref:Uncharacterized protein n=1 Tax=Hymenoscyphus fraxineus TaxID=746836 RepID=A0A9N9L991_9HELO|nr:hypothetical protein HYFRA_00013062 [Hymenoscyphus fraxineus]
MSTPPNPQKENTTQRPAQSHWIPQSLLNSKELFENPQVLSLLEKSDIDRERFAEQIIDCFALGHYVRFLCGYKPLEREKEALEKLKMDLIQEYGEFRSNEDKSTSSPEKKMIG